MKTLSTNYTNEASFKVYIDYLALKRHFTTDGYDYQKYNGKTKASFQSYQTRNDAYFFYKLSSKKNWHELLLANIVKNTGIWVRDLCEPIATDVYNEWKKRTDALTRTFTVDIKQIDPVLQNNFIVSSGKTPKLINLHMTGQISLETFSILTYITNVFPYWEQQLAYDVVAKDEMRLSKKYFPFLDVDKKKFSSILKDYVE